MKTYGLLGFPLKHSFSAAYFTEKFVREGLLGLQYLNFEYGDLPQAVTVLRANANLLGFNVTIPYKEKILPILDEIDPTAEAIQAVNAVHVADDKWIGYNTDVIGFEASLVSFLQQYNTIPSLKALVLGTGGASKAVHYVLLKLGIPFIPVSRTPRPGAFSYQQVTHDIMLSTHLIINTTPLGTFPNINDLPHLPYESLTRKHLLYDLVYNPEVTAFMQKGLNTGCAVKNGHEMLLAQAEAAWEIWNKQS